MCLDVKKPMLLYLEVISLFLAIFFMVLCNVITDVHLCIYVGCVGTQQVQCWGLMKFMSDSVFSVLTAHVHCL